MASKNMAHHPSTWEQSKRVINITDCPIQTESSESEEDFQRPRGKTKRSNFNSTAPPPVKRRRTEFRSPQPHVSQHYQNIQNNLYINPSSQKDLPKRLANRTGDSIRVTILQNTGDMETLRGLIICKELLAQCLPEMPLSHILKLIMDPRQFTIAMWASDEEDSLMAAVSARPFLSQCFVEVAFLGVKIGSQYQGYGTLIMNYLKEYIKRELKCYYILTFADAAAVGFFEKQGFSSKVTLEKRAWQPCIKTYKDAKFMECHSIPEIDYLRTKKILKEHKESLMRKIHISTNILKEYPGLKRQNAHGAKRLRRILGLSPEEVERARKEQPKVHVRILRANAKMAAIVEHLMKKSFSEPFRHPVENDQAPNYYDVITSPMDLSSMMKKINSHYYQSEQQFKADFQLIVSNCHLFNGDQADNHWVAMVKELHDCFREQSKIHFPKVPKQKNHVYRSLNRNIIGINATNGKIKPREKHASHYNAMDSGTFTRM